MEEATSVMTSLMKGFATAQILQELETDIPPPDGPLITTPSDKDSLKTVAVPPTPPTKYWLCDVRDVRTSMMVYQLTNLLHLNLPEDRKILDRKQDYINSHL